MTGKGNNKNDKKNAALSVLVCAGIGAGVAIALAFLSSAILLFAPDPASFYYPAGLASLYAGAFAAGFILRKKTDLSPAFAILPGAAIAALAAAAGAFVKGQSGRPALLTALLFALIPAASLLGALPAGRKTKRRPYAGRRPRKRR